MMIKIIQDSRLSHNKIQSSEISKIKNHDYCQQSDYLAVETPLEIRLGHNQTQLHSFAVTMCSPADIEDLIVGYLFTEAIIQKPQDIESIHIFDNELGMVAETILVKSIDYKKYLNKRQSRVHASCGVCGKTEFDDLLTFNYPTTTTQNPEIPAEIIQSLPEKLNQQQQAFAQTGGLHASALFDQLGNLLDVKEDIGRHNALDKLIGAALNKDSIPLSECVVLLSGRISFELVHKSLMAGVKTLTAIGAPSSLSVEIAKVNQLNLIGFIKADGYNVYAEKFSKSE